MSEPEVDCALSSAAGPRVMILLCTYNEIGNLPQLFDVLWQEIPQADILVVDDNSPDGTGRWVEQQTNNKSQLFLISRMEKRGLGSAVREGLAWSLSRGYEYVINLDADLSHNPADASRLLQGCTQTHTRVDVSIGSRYIAGGGVVGLSGARKLASKLLNVYATRLLRLPVHDCSGSFRCYRSSILRELDFSLLTCNGYGFLEEILCHLHRRGAALAEFPIVYEHRHSGRSKLTLADALGALLVIHRLAVKS